MLCSSIISLEHWLVSLDVCSCTSTLVAKRQSFISILQLVYLVSRYYWLNLANDNSKSIKVFPIGSKKVREFLTANQVNDLYRHVAATLELSWSYKFIRPLHKIWIGIYVVIRCKEHQLKKNSDNLFHSLYILRYKR